MKKISEVKSFLFDNHIILSFSKDWIDVFKEIPEFEVMIDSKNRLHLISKVANRNEK